MSESWGGLEVPPGWGSPPPGPGWAPLPKAPEGAAAASRPTTPGYGPPPAPQPGVVPLRPLSLGELFAGALVTVRRTPRQVFAAAALVVGAGELVALPAALLVGPRSGDRLTGEELPGAGELAAFAASSATAALVSAVASLVLAGVLAPLCAEAVLGRRLGGTALWRRVRPVLPRLLGVAVLAGTLPYLTLPLLGFGVFLWGAFALAAPALVLERLGVAAALRRSWALGVPDFWRVFGVRALTVLLVGLAAFVVQLPFVVAAASAVADGSATGVAVAALAGFAGGVVTEPFLALVLTLLYVDRRMRAERLDVTLAQASSAA